MNLNQLKTANSLLNYDYAISCVSSNEFVLSYEGKYYKIGEFMYRILREGQKATHLEDLLVYLGNNADISLATLKEIIETKVLPIFNTPEEKGKDLSEGFWVKKQILSSQQSTALAKPLSFLFGKSFYPLFVILAGVNIALYYGAKSKVAGQYIPEGYEMLSWIAAYFSLFFIMFVHELGHAAAAIKSGIKARSIGLGVYTIMPAMYTDLTDIWKMPKANRIKVNLAGVFIQLIISTGIVAALHLVTNEVVQNIIWKIYIFNSILIVMNLVPFLKLDGYWVLSDLLGVPNLIQTSNKLLLDAVTRKDPFEESRPLELSFRKIILVVYSVLRVLFIIAMTVSVLTFIYVSILKTITLIRYIPYLSFNLETAVELLKRIFTIVIISLFTRRYRKIFSSIVLKRMKWYRA